MSDSKSPQVSRTLLSILADLNNAVVYIVSIRLVISKSSSQWINTLVTVPRAPITIGIFVAFMLYSFFNSLARYRYLSFFSVSVVSRNSKVHISTSSLSFVDYYVWLSGRDKVIRLYLKIPEEFVRLIFQGGFWVVRIPFVCMVKFQFLAQFPNGSPCQISCV